jgi:hypothetical protein
MLGMIATVPWEDDQNNHEGHRQKNELNPEKGSPTEELDDW